MAYSDRGASPLTALESAMKGLPKGFEYSADEMTRCLRRNHYDVMATALHLKTKLLNRQEQKMDDLNIMDVYYEIRKGYLLLLDEVFDRCHCPIVIFRPCFLRPDVHSDLATKTRDQEGGVDGTSSLHEIQKTFVYLLDQAREIMEEEQSPGIVYIIDLDKVVLADNLDTSIYIDLMKMMKDQYPETVQKIFVLNGIFITSVQLATNNFECQKFKAGTVVEWVIKHLFSKMALPPKLREKIVVLPDDQKGGGSKFSQPKSNFAELLNFISSRNLPVEYGGKYEIPNVKTWINSQAELEDVADLLPVEEDSKNTVLVHENEIKYLDKDALELNGMQYAGCSADEVINDLRFNNSIRGQIYKRKTSDFSSHSLLSSDWKKMYAILRPDSILVYTDLKGKKPEFIIPLKNSQAKADKFPDVPRGCFGFRIDQPPMTSYLLAVGNEGDRIRWLQAIQTCIENTLEKEKKEIFEMEEKERAEEAFQALEMISFDDDPQVQNPRNTSSNQVHQLPGNCITRNEQESQQSFNLSKAPSSYVDYGCQSNPPPVPQSNFKTAPQQYNQQYLQQQPYYNMSPPNQMNLNQQYIYNNPTSMNPVMGLNTMGIGSNGSQNFNASTNMMGMNNNNPSTYQNFGSNYQNNRGGNNMNSNYASHQRQ